MTTINVEILSDRIAVATDGGVSSKSRISPVAMSKVYPLANMNAVIAGRGPVPVTIWLAWFASHFTTLSDLRDGLPDLLRKRYGMMAKLFPKSFGFDFVVAGYENGHPIAFEVTSKTWQARSITDFYAAPAVETQGLPVISATSPRDTDMQAERAMLALMRRQRQVHGNIGCSCFAQLTTIIPNGTIITRKLCDFK